MSSPANIGVISSGHLRIYYGRHDGNSAPFVCLGGPDWIVESAGLDMSPSDGWLGEAYAEGGVLVDLDKRVLLVHGASEYFNELGFRRTFLSLLRDLNPSWVINWAHGGQGDFLAHLGLEPASIFNTIEPEPLAGVDVGKTRNPVSVCTVRTDRELQLYALDFGEPQELCSMGLGLVDRLAELQTTDSVEFDGTDIYFGGLHIDRTTQTLKVWTMDPIAALETRFSRDWPGWSIKSWSDSIEHHIVAANNRIRYSMAPEVEHLIRLRKLLRGSFEDAVPKTAPVRDEIERRISKLT